MNAIICGSSAAVLSVSSHQLNVSGERRRAMEQPQPFLTVNESPASTFGLTPTEISLSET